MLYQMFWIFWVWLGGLEKGLSGTSQVLEPTYGRTREQPRFG